MNFFRALLRKWLVPEIVDFVETTEKVKKDLHEQVCKEILVIKGMERIAEERIQGQIGALFLKFKGHKQIAVKDALKLLLARLKLEIIVHEVEDRELVPHIRSIKSRPLAKGQFMEVSHDPS